jgi:hypothetical protein
VHNAIATCDCVRDITFHVPPDACHRRTISTAACSLSVDLGLSGCVSWFTVPKHLHQEFERDYQGAFGWEYLEAGPATWRIRISKLASAPAPHILCDVEALANAALLDRAAGAIWQLQVGERQLDANTIHLQPEGRIEPHLGPSSTY